MTEISFIDTTLRDGQQSLWALGMKTDAMLGAAAQMDRIGFESMEFFVSIMVILRRLNIFHRRSFEVQPSRSL